MNIILARTWRRASSRSPVVLPLLIASFVFITSWPLLAWVQPGSDIVQPENFWWYFLITTTTVGYGDFFPETAGGKLVGGYIVVGGLTTIAVLVSQLGSFIENKKGRRMQGQGKFTGSDHIVILGYHPGRTDHLITTLLADHPDRHIVLCAWEDQASEHPMPTHERVHFMRGDLAETDLLHRANMERCRAVLVDAKDDHEAVTLTIASADEAPQAYTVVALRDLRRKRTIDRVDQTAHCVQWHSTQMILEELQDPGIALVYAELASPGGAGTYSATVPDSVSASYGEWQQALGQRFGATLMAVQSGGSMQVNPPWDTPVRPGDHVFYIAPKRLSHTELASAVG